MGFRFSQHDQRDLKADGESLVTVHTLTPDGTPALAFFLGLMPVAKMLAIYSCDIV